MSTATIRMATKEDAALIADLSRRTFYDTFSVSNTAANMEKFMQKQFSREVLMAEVEEENGLFLLAFRNNVPVGYVRMREETLPELGTDNAIEIVRIYVEQSEAGKGTGKLLMQYCLDIAKQQHKQVIWLGVWEHNQRAISFYLKWGFEQFGTHIFMLGDDPQTDWLMKKSL